jgi:hypothetical protein
MRSNRKRNRKLFEEANDGNDSGNNKSPIFIFITDKFDDDDDEDYQPSIDNDDDDYFDDEVEPILQQIPKRAKIVKNGKSTKPTKTVTFDHKITTLDELITLGESYSPTFTYICNLNLEKLSKILVELREIRNLIGLTSLKRSIVKQIVFLLLEIQTADDCDMRHVVLNGDPGCGKTTVAQIIGKIYSKLGLLSKGTFTVGKRTDFVAKWLGQTEHKTKKFLETCLGGVLFIDEVYSLAPDCGQGTDSYSKIVIDTLNEFLSQNSKDFICIIAGYKDDIDKQIFDRNKGMDRRFPYRYVIEGYNANELLQIFQKFVKESHWSLEEDAISSSIFSQKELFKFYGGDVRTFFEKCKEIHSERAVMIPKESWKTLSKTDINEGFEAYKTDRDLNNRWNHTTSLYI